jgi:hypothetical protein
MSAEPTYPDDAPVGDSPGKAKPDGTAPGDPDTEKLPESKRTRNIVTGAAIGIGSAALVAALLYANRSRGGKGTARKDSEKG